MKVTIDAKRARELLATNTRNRRVSKKLVQVYASDMAAGRWEYNGDPIRVSVDGVLLDGQHRLLAIVESGVAIECEFIEKLPDSVAKTIDGGRKRSAADVLNMLDGGSMMTVGIAASAKLILNYLDGWAMGSSVSTPSIVNLVHEHQDIVTKHQMARVADKIVLPSALGAILFLGTRAVGMEKRAQSFADALKSGEGLESGDPRLALRNAFINARLRSSTSGQIEHRWAFAIITSCWNAWATGREITNPKVIPTRDGKVNVSDILGGPKVGAGLEGLKEVRIHKRQKLADDLHIVAS